MKKIVLGILYITLLRINSSAQDKFNCWEVIHENDFPQALQCAQYMDTLTKAVFGDTSLEWLKLTYGTLAPIYAHNKKFIDAEQILKKALSIARWHYPDSINISSNIKATLANNYFLMGNLGSGKKIIDSAWLEIMPLKIRYWPAYKKVVSTLIDAYMLSGSFNTAMQSAKNLLEDFKTLPADNFDRLLLYNSIGSISIKLGAFHEAIYYLKECEKLILRTKTTESHKVILKYSIAMAYAMRQRLDSAIAYCDDILNYGNKEQNDEVEKTKVNTMNLMAMIIGREYRKPDAAHSFIIEHLKKKPYEAYSSHCKYVIDHTLMITHFMNTRYDSSLIYANRCKQLETSFLSNDFQFNITTSYCRHFSLLLLGENQSSYNEYARLQQYIRVNLTDPTFAYSDVQKAGFLSDLAEMSLLSPNYLGATGIDRTLATRSIYDQHLFITGYGLRTEAELMKYIRKQESPIIQRQYQNWTQVKRLLSKELLMPVNMRSANFDSLAAEAERMERDLKHTSSLKDSFITNSTITCKDLSKKLKPTEVFLHFIRYLKIDARKTTKYHYGIFIIRDNDSTPVFLDLISEDRLLKHLRILKSDTVHNKNWIQELYPDNKLREKSIEFAGDAIGNLLSQSLTSYLKNKKTIYIVPDGIFYKIALHALPLSKTTILMDVYKIRYLSTPHTLLKHSESEVGIHYNSISCWGGINYTKSKCNTSIFGEIWPYLRGTHEEISTVENLAKSRGISYTVYTGNDATKAAFIEQENGYADILHIATHGKYRADIFSKTGDATQIDPYIKITFTKNPLHIPQLIMASKEEYATADSNCITDNMILTGYDIASLDMHRVKLVVLSSCETGLGDIHPGEGIFNMQRAFKIAGADKVLVSLWPIPDKGTNQFMKYFYQYLLIGNTPAEALYYAQMSMRKISAPYYWAGFILVE